MEDEIIAQFRAGDPDAVRVVYQRFARPIATVARSIVGNDQALIDEVVQHTFTKAWRAASGFRPGRDIAPWLYAIARRTAIDAIRAERHPTRGDHEPEVDVAVPPASLERTWETYQVRLAVEDLPPDEREIIRLGHLNGLSHSEISERLGVPIGTVKSRSHRATRRLAVSLAHVVAEPPPMTSHPPPARAGPRPPPRGGNQPDPPDVLMSRE